jgi:hypothetical protein
MRIVRGADDRLSYRLHAICSPRRHRPAPESHRLAGSTLWASGLAPSSRVVALGLAGARPAAGAADRAGSASSATATAPAPPVPAPDVPQADRAFREGKQAIKDHRLGEACAKFAESQRLDPQPGTLLYLATCHAEQEKTATAWTEYKDAEALAQRMGKSERMKEARARIVDIEGKLSRVQIQIPGAAPGVTVRANGRELRDYGAPLPFDPGPLTVEANALGCVPSIKTIDVPPGPSNQVVVVPAPSPLPNAAGAAPPAPAPVDTARLARLAAERRTRWIAAGTLGGAGVVGIVVGSAFGALASQKYKSAESAGGCGPTTCVSYATFKAGYSDALGSAYVSTAAFVVGGAALAAGAVVALAIPGRTDVRLGAGPGPSLNVGGAF